MRLTKTYADGTYGVADDLPCGENSHAFKKLLIDTLGAFEDGLQAELTKEREANTKKDEVMKWYANEDNYLQIKRWRGDPASPIDCDILDDRGKRARSILEGNEPNEGTHNS